MIPPPPFRAGARSNTRRGRSYAAFSGSTSRRGPAGREAARLAPALVCRGLNPGRRQARAAFTLVELLITIVIIAVLAGLLVPVLSRAKARAMNVVCIGNFKQLEAAWKMYADDNAGRLASGSYFVDGLVNLHAWVRGSMDDNTKKYPPVQPGVLDSTNVNGLKLGSLYTYSQSAGIYHCPADPSTVAGVRRVRSYSLNGWMGGTTVYGEHEYTVFRHESDIVKPSPSAAWVFIDEHEKSINDGWFAVDMDGNRGLLDAPATRHANSFSLSFADGHVEVWKLLDSRTEKWSRLPISNHPQNPDWQRLQAATTSLQ